MHIRLQIDVDHDEQVRALLDIKDAFMEEGKGTVVSGGNGER